MRAILLVALVVFGCSDPKPPSNDPPQACKLDVDCAGRGYCTEAGICRRDCYVDEHCIGPGLGGQCNSQGKCIEPVDASGPTGDTSDDGGSVDGADEAIVTDDAAPEGGV